LDSRFDESSLGCLQVGDTRLALGDPTEACWMRETREPDSFDEVWFLYNCQWISWTDSVRKCEMEIRLQ
jgi:hypothetical protein